MKRGFVVVLNIDIESDIELVESKDASSDMKDHCNNEDIYRDTFTFNQR